MSEVFENVIRRPLRPTMLKEKFSQGVFTVLVAMQVEEAEEADVDTKLYVLGRRITGELYSRSDSVTYKQVGTVGDDVIFEVTYERSPQNF